MMDTVIAIQQTAILIVLALIIVGWADKDGDFLSDAWRTVCAFALIGSGATAFILGVVRAWA